MHISGREAAKAIKSLGNSTQFKREMTALSSYQWCDACAFEAGQIVTRLNVSRRVGAWLAGRSRWHYDRTGKPRTPDRGHSNSLSRYHLRTDVGSQCLKMRSRSRAAIDTRPSPFFGYHDCGMIAAENLKKDQPSTDHSGSVDF